MQTDSLNHGNKMDATDCTECIFQLRYVISQVEKTAPVGEDGLLSPVGYFFQLRSLDVGESSAEKAERLTEDGCFSYIIICASRGYS